MNRLILMALALSLSATAHSKNLFLSYPTELQNEFKTALYCLDFFVRHERLTRDEHLTVSDRLNQLISEHGDNENFGGVILTVEMNPSDETQDAYLFTSTAPNSYKRKTLRIGPSSYLNWSKQWHLLRR